MKIEEARKRYGVGIDTGGTFTDAVLLDLDSRNILKTVKCPTTHYNVGLGVVEALSSLLVNVERKSIEIIAFSTTLATNTVAEGQGAKVGPFDKELFFAVTSSDDPLKRVRVH